MASAAPDTIKWFQLYVFKERSITEQLIRRVELAGFKALVLTVDVPIFGIRRADVRNQFTLPKHLKFANFKGEKNQFINEEDEDTDVHSYVHATIDETLNWNDVKWLIGFTKLPVIVKGVLAVEDAVLAADIGCSGVIVSNHGARQLDSVQPSVSTYKYAKMNLKNKHFLILDRSPSSHCTSGWPSNNRHDGWWNSRG